MTTRFVSFAVSADSVESVWSRRFVARGLFGRGLRLLLQDASDGRDAQVQPRTASVSAILTLPIVGQRVFSR